MSTQHYDLEVNLQTINDKIKFSAKSRSNPEVVIDYFPPFGDGEGYTPLELLLFSFASCVSSTLAILLRGKMRRNVSSIKATAKGKVREEHPKAISEIHLELCIYSEDTEESDVNKSLAALEDKICPVWAMLKGNVEIETEYTICKDQG